MWSTAILPVDRLGLYDKFDNRKNIFLKIRNSVRFQAILSKIFAFFLHPTDNMRPSSKWIVNPSISRRLSFLPNRSNSLCSFHRNKRWQPTVSLYPLSFNRSIVLNAIISSSAIFLSFCEQIFPNSHYGNFKTTPYTHDQKPPCLRQYQLSASTGSTYVISSHSYLLKHNSIPKTVCWLPFISIANKVTFFYNSTLKILLCTTL